MAGQRNRYVKVALFEPSTTNLQGGTIVGQSGDYILVERPPAKPRASRKGTTSVTPRKPRKPRTPKPANQPATSFPPQQEG
jgi:hypothetical protein